MSRRRSLHPLRPFVPVELVEASVEHAGVEHAENSATPMLIMMASAGTPCSARRRRRRRRPDADKVSLGSASGREVHETEQPHPLPGQHALRAAGARRSIGPPRELFGTVGIRSGTTAAARRDAPSVSGRATPWSRAQEPAPHTRRSSADSG